MGESKWQALQDWGRRHLQFCLELYQLQIDQGRYVLHEHPAFASSWDEDFMVAFNAEKQAIESHR